MPANRKPEPTERALITLDNRISTLSKSGGLTADAARRLCTRFGEAAVIESLVACCAMLRDRTDAGNALP